MTINTGPFQTGVPVANPPAIIANQETSVVTGIPASRASFASRGVNTDINVTATKWNRSARQQLSSLLNNASTIANYQPGVGVTGTLNASAWANQIGAAGSLEQATGSAQPIYLPYTGEKYAYLPGVAGNNFSAPATVGATITGNYTQIVLVAMDAWKPASAMDLFTKRNGASAPRFGINATTGFPIMESVSGTLTADAAPTVADGSFLWVAVESTKDNGAGGSDAKFYTAPYSSSTSIPAPASFTQLGTTRTGAWTTAPNFNNGIAWRVGTYGDGVGNPTKGKVERALLYSGLYSAGTATLVADFNAADWSETSTNAATQVSSTTGETWTLNNTGALLAQIVGSPQLVGNGSAHFMQTAAATIDAPYCVISVEKIISWTSGDVSFDGRTANSFAFQQITGSPQARIHDGTADSSTISPTLGAYNIIVASQAADGTLYLQVNDGTPVTGTQSATAMAGLTEFADGAGANFVNKQLKEKIVLSEVPSAAKLAQIKALLNAIHGVY